MVYRYNCTHSPPQLPPPHTHTPTFFLLLKQEKKTRMYSSRPPPKVLSSSRSWPHLPGPGPCNIGWTNNQYMHFPAGCYWSRVGKGRKTLARSTWREGSILHERTGSLVRSIYKEAHNSDCPCSHLWPQGKSALDWSWCYEWPEMERSQVLHNITGMLIIHANTFLNFSLCEIGP